MDRAGVQADAVGPLVDPEPDRIALDVSLPTLDEQPLGVHPPELIVIPERGDELGGSARIEGDGMIRVTIPGDDAIDPAVRPVAERRLVGVALSGLEALRRRVVL